MSSDRPSGAAFDGPHGAPPVSSVIADSTWSRATTLAERFRAARPFPHVVIDGLLNEEFCRRVAREFPPYDAQLFRNEWGESGKAHHERVAGLGPAFRQLHDALNSADFLDLAARISGIPNLVFDPEYFGGGTHENLHGMELDPHIDFNLHPMSKLHRRLNLLLYFNEGWSPDWGGTLELHTNPWLHPTLDETAQVCPEFNRCVIFETSDHSWHGFRRIALPAAERHRSRRSLALYLYTRERPPGPLIPYDITIYADRPIPDRICPGRTLTDEDARELEILLARRDRKLEYLYGRAIDYAQPTLMRSVERQQAALAVDVTPGLFIDSVQVAIVGRLRGMRDALRTVRSRMRGRALR